jgi:hypothetical protein
MESMVVSDRSPSMRNKRAAGATPSRLTLARPPRPVIGRAPPLPGERHLQLPHERDESPRPEGGSPHGPRDRVCQAGRDVDRGLVDTEARGTPFNVPRGRRARTGGRS